MSVTFTKLFSSITESTVWCEPSDIRIVWITMLAMSDKRGRVWGSIPGLANRAQVPIEACRKAITTFLSPDPDSRTKDFEGRRIVEIDGGWQLLNHGKYRAIRDEDERRAYKAEHERERRRTGKVKSRAKHGQEHGQSGQSWTGVDTGGHNAEADTEAEAEKQELSKKPMASSHPADAGSVDRKHPDLLIYEAYPRREGRGNALRAIAKAVVRVSRGEDDLGGPCTAYEAQKRLWKITAAYATSPAGKNPDLTKIPHPATWFNQSRYLDDKKTWQLVNGGENGGNHHYQPKPRSQRTVDEARAAIEGIARNLGLGQDGDPPTGEGCGPA